MFKIIINKIWILFKVELLMIKLIFKNKIYMNNYLIIQIKKLYNICKNKIIINKKKWILKKKQNK